MTSFPALRIGAALAAALFLTSCEETSDSSIENVCDALCSVLQPWQATQTPLLTVLEDTQTCVSTVETIRDNAHAASCDDVFSGYFQSLERGDVTCAGAPNLEDSYSYIAVTECIDRNDPDNVCYRAFNYINACQGQPEQLYSGPACTGPQACFSICVLNTACDLFANGGGGGPGAEEGFNQCQAACQFLPPFGGD